MTPWLLVVAPWIVLLVACGGSRETLDLRSDVERGRYRVGASETRAEAPLAFAAPPEAARATVGHESRFGVLTGLGVWSWRGEVPEDSRLSVGACRDPATGGELEITVRLRQGSSVEILERVRSPAGEASWLDFEVDLTRYAGRRVTLEFESNSSTASPGGEGDPGVVWAPVTLASATRRRPRDRDRPNIVLIVVDTLRFDRTTPYGHSRDTTPEIQALLAEPGAVVQNAYAQAPWTLPSMVSLMTGRHPGELIDAELETMEVPPEVESLAEVVGASGYETAAFVANPVLQEWNGFARGFKTFYSPPARVDSLRLHAGDELQGRVLRWLRVYQNRRFFLYVHYLDPHDPYVNPDMMDGRSRYDPDYPGPLTGASVHGVYTGRTSLKDPGRDVEYLRGLYDQEVQYVDRHIGELLRSLAPAVLSNTLVVLTADHGEELFDHQGWKHGESLYEEQVHVPLLLRWDGRIPAGARPRETVELVDLWPTLVAASGGEVPDTAGGVNLLPGLLAGRLPSPRAALLQRLSWGPWHAAVVAGGKKLILYNHRAGFEPRDPAQEYLWRKDLERLKRVELYDLGSDPGERTNLASQDPETVAALAPWLHALLARHVPDLRVLASGLRPGGSLEARIEFASEPERIEPYFLDDGDTWRQDGQVLSLRLQGDVLEKGVIVMGENVQVAGVTARVDGVPVGCESIGLGARTACEGPVTRGADLWVGDWPDPAPGPALRLFKPRLTSSRPRPSAARGRTREHLRTLGYLP